MNPHLENRVAKLERTVRFYRLAFLGVFILSIGFILVSFNNKKSAPDVIEAKAFHVVDERGNTLVKINQDYNNGAISTFTPGGRKLVSLFTSNSGAGGINTFDKDGEVIFKVTNTTSGGGYMALFNANRKEIAEWGVTNAESGYFRLNDRYGEKLAWITYTQGGGGYFSLSDKGQELFRFSTTGSGARAGFYNGSGDRIAYIGAQDNKDGNITIWNSAGTRTGGLPQ